MSYSAVKGTNDLFDAQADGYAYIENVIKAVTELYGYRHIVTPILEHTEVFDRSAGESSDVVRKQMYTFEDKAGRSITLRPEGTAGVIRSVVEHKLYATEDLPLKLSYVGPMFRYERPQLGRYRQFVQGGCEAIGVDSPRLDAETVAMAMQILSMLGFEGLKVKLNTLGDDVSRKAYKEALKAYFEPHIVEMCDDCKQRLILNPLRILDCKVPSDIELAKGAPKMRDYLSEESEKRFYQTISILNDLGIEYEIDDSLVRGLDYYSELVFEIHAVSKEGHDYGALGGGGHYSGLLSTFNGPKDCDVGVGFAMGVDRLYALMRDNGLLDGLQSGLDLYMMPLGEEVRDAAFTLAENIRLLGYSLELPFTKGKISSFFKKAERRGAKFALILGEDELQRGVIQLKNLATQEQKEVAIETLDVTLDEEFSKLEEHDHHDCDDPECHCHDHH